MKDTKPLQRNKNLVWLSRDHHEGLLLVWKIRHGIEHAISPFRISNLVVHAFAEELEPHFHAEEHLIFNELSINDHLRQKAEEQHRQLRNQLVKLKPQVKATAHDLEVFANLLDEHIRFEERILFPHIQEQLSEEVLQNIGGILEEEHLVHESFNWTDEFWKRDANDN